ncbi:hypothetical protein O6H91_16G073500 [Diphasiastrum complanatum]|uniref:Uncharacterized protein n=1 Tax=Diphasiastrum complanatum TaxID=34168 RepID=A0ACC2BDN9_DIPCM|nr:hypothetical protein O6H91_16G073500 [Diphasiastrum complanatum]
MAKGKRIKYNFFSVVNYLPCLSPIIYDGFTYYYISALQFLQDFVNMNHIDKHTIFSYVAKYFLCSKKPDFSYLFGERYANILASKRSARMQRERNKKALCCKSEDLLYRKLGVQELLENMQIQTGSLCCLSP